MEYNIKLSKDECEFILNALQFLQKENLEKSLEAIKNTKYEDVKELYVSRDFFENDKQYKQQMINEQIEAIENIYGTISSEMED